MSMEVTMNDARRTAKDVTDAANAQLTATQDRIISFTQEKPLIALLSALALGIVVGKIAL